jgi:hypothetical protein
MSTTDAAEYKFTVKEGEASATGKDDAPLSLMCEPTSKELDIVGNHGFLSIRLAKGTTYEEAQSFAKILQKKVSGISYTKL